MLVVRAGALACGIPLLHVAETMRPLPIEPVAGAPGFLRGLALIRGAPTPVVDLGALLSRGEVSATYGRFVTVKVGERRVALGVDEVIGSRSLDASALGDLPPILRDIAGDLIEWIGSRDTQLLVVLRAARILPDELWKLVAASTTTTTPAPAAAAAAATVLAAVAATKCAAE